MTSMMVAIIGTKMTKKRPIPFEDFVIFLKQNQSQLDKAELDYWSTGKPGILTLTFRGGYAYKFSTELRYKEEFFEIAKELFKLTLE